MTLLPEIKDRIEARLSLGKILMTKARWSEAEPELQAALDEATQIADSNLSSWAMNELTILLQETNRLAEAEPLIRRALAMDEHSYGAEHPAVARDLNNLATLLNATNRLAEAEPLMRRALAIFSASFGSNHPRALTAARNLEMILSEIDNVR